MFWKFYSTQSLVTREKQNNWTWWGAKFHSHLLEETSLGVACFVSSLPMWRYYQWSHYSVDTKLFLGGHWIWIRSGETGNIWFTYWYSVPKNKTSKVTRLWHWNTLRTWVLCELKYIPVSACNWFTTNPWRRLFIFMFLLNNANVASGRFPRVVHGYAGTDLSLGHLAAGKYAF